MNPAAFLCSPYRWLLHSEGSARVLALIRIGLVLNVWARWADERVLFRDLDPENLLLGCVFYISSTCALLGWFTRTATAALAGTTWYLVFVVGHLNQHQEYTHHHTTLLAWGCLFIALADSGKSLSVDRFLSVRKAERSNLTPPSERVNLWAQRLIAIQVSSVYFWGAIHKCNQGFLSGARLTHYLQYYYTGPEDLAHQFPHFRVIMMILAVLTVALEFALAVGLFFRRSRRWLLIPGLLLHGAFYVSLSVLTFTTTMWTMYLAFFEPDGIDAVMAKVAPPRVAPG